MQLSVTATETLNMGPDEAVEVKSHIAVVVVVVVVVVVEEEEEGVLAENASLQAEVAGSIVA